MVEAAKHYIRRWDIEESTRWLKDHRGWGLGLEEIRLLTFRGVQRMIQLIIVIHLFSLHLRLDCAPLVAKLGLLTRVRATRDPPHDVRYRLMAGIRDALFRSSDAVRRCLRRHPHNTG